MYVKYGNLISCAAAIAKKNKNWPGLIKKKRIIILYLTASAASFTEATQSFVVTFALPNFTERFRLELITLSCVYFFVLNTKHTLWESLQRHLLFLLFFFPLHDFAESSHLLVFTVWFIYTVCSSGAQGRSFYKSKPLFNHTFSLNKKTCLFESKEGCSESNI